jgi:ParB-like chromosome segregation protein Spo0J
VQVKIHPLSEIFPSLSGKQWDEFKADIEANGQREPILTVCDGQTRWIVDGKNRYRAVTELGKTPIFEEWDKQGSLVELVCSRNLHRRDLTPSIRAQLALDLMPFFEKEAMATKNANLKIGKNPNVSRKGHVATSGNSSENAAAVVGASGRTVRRAARVAEAAPEKADAIRKGEKTVAQAEREIKEAKAAEIPPEDGLGRPVADKALWPAFKSEVFRDVLADIQRARAKVKALLDSDMGVHVGQGAEANLKMAYSELKQSAPYAPCVYCRSGCKACLKQRWITKIIYDAAPEEMKR